MNDGVNEGAIVSAPHDPTVSVAHDHPAVVALCMPHYGQVTFEAAESFRNATGPGTSIKTVVRLGNPGSILTSNFNRAWCSALNRREDLGVTHFAMLHSDVAAEKGWLDTLLSLLRRYQADVVSAVVPLKTEHGLTSTAVGTGSVYLNRRLSLSELHQLPETFTNADVERSLGVKGPLLVNTGCWIADLRRPWCDDCDERGVLKWAFRFENEIQRDPRTGHFHSFAASEDWLFSRHLATVGARVYATRAVRLRHVGDHHYVNDRPWGDWETDEAFASVMTELVAQSERRS